MRSADHWTGGELPFTAGLFEGWGRWVNTTAQGNFRVRYTITDALGGAVQHAVRREFLSDAGATLYVEETTVLFTPGERQRLRVVITGPRGSVEGDGYVFGNQCHYESDVAPGTRLEFTFTVIDSRHIDGLASSTSREGVTCWRERLAWVEPPAVDDDSSGAFAQDYTDAL